jgi:ketosteroid isomerase-like protein
MAPTSGRCARTDLCYTSYALILLLALLVGGCGPAPGEPEAQIRTAIESARDLARAGDAKALAAMLAADYEDEEGRDRRAMALTIRTLLGRYPRHLALVDDLQIHVISGELATARMTVSLVGRDGGRPVLHGLDADRLRLDLAFRRAGDVWLVTRASWGSPGQAVELSAD